MTLRTKYSGKIPLVVGAAVVAAVLMALLPLAGCDTNSGSGGTTTTQQSGTGGNTGAGGTSTGGTSTGGGTTGTGGTSSGGTGENVGTGQNPPATPATYTVTFNANGGSEVASQTVESGKTASKPTDPTKAGHIFAGWYTSADGGATLDATAYDFAAPVAADTTLHAKWTPAYVVTTADGTTTNYADLTAAVAAIKASASCTLTIPAGVTTIGDNAFQECSGLTSVTIPDSVTTIGEFAFDSCGSLTSVTIPAGVTSIGAGVFACSGLTSVTIPDSVTTIGNYAFDSCSGLTSVTIPDSVTSIGDYAFQGCLVLTSVTIPTRVTTIGMGTFSYSGLTSITIPANVTSIGESAFHGCGSLTSVTIPAGVTTIGFRAFADCTGLTSVEFEDTSNWYMGSSSGDTTGEAITVTAPAANASNLKADTGAWYNKYLNKKTS